MKQPRQTPPKEGVVNSQGQLFEEINWQLLYETWLVNI